MSGLFGHLFSRQKTRHAIVIDAASDDTIRSLLFDFGPKDHSIIEKRFIRIPTRPLSREFAAFSDGIRMHLAAFTREIGHTPHALVIGLGNRFTTADLVEWRRERPAPDAIRKEEVSSLVDEFKKANPEKIINGVPFRLVDIAPLSLTVDGYPVIELGPGTRGKRLEATILATYADPAFADALSKVTTEKRSDIAL